MPEYLSSGIGLECASDIEMPIDGDVHLWSLTENAVATEPLLPHATEWLAPNEMARLHNLKNPRVAHRFLLGRILLRRTLSRYLSRCPEDFRFEIVGNGKLSLASPLQGRLDFNLSHDNETAILAVVGAGTIGADVVSLGRAHAVHRIAKQFFSVHERREIDEAGDEASLVALKLWVLKESIAKAVGGSIWDALASVSLSVRNSEIRWQSRPLMGDPAEWALKIGYYNDDHLLAIAHRRSLSARTGRLVVRRYTKNGAKFCGDVFRQLNVT